MVERGVQQNGFFLFILVGPIVWFTFLGKYGVPWTEFWSWDVLFHIFFAKSMALFKFKKRGIGYI